MFGLILLGATLVVIGIVAACLAYGVLVFNRLVRLKHEAARAWSNVEVLIRQRHDEIPKLVETCKRFLVYERETLVGVLRARRAVATASGRRDLQQLGIAETQLRHGMCQLLAAVEAYPMLKADESFRRLETRIVDLENAISDRRELFNECVNNHNVRLDQFPDCLIARLFGFEAYALLRFEVNELTDVNLRELFA